MKILSLGLDNSVLDKNSPLAKRVIEYGNLTEKYTVIVPAKQNLEVELSGCVKVFGLAGGNKFFKLIKIYNLAEKLIKKEKYDLITVQDVYFLALVALILVREFNLGFEIQVHGFEKLGGWRKMIAGYSLPKAGAVRTVSQRLKRYLMEKFKVQEKRIIVAPIYKDIRNENYDARRKNPGSGKFVFLTVGRLVAVKNIKMQIEALAEILKIHPEAELWIAGDGPEKENLESKVNGLKLEQRIKFWGWQNDLNRFYEQADVFLLTSDYEGWGLSVIEAADSGLPIIMTDVGCAGELVKDGESGLIVPIQDQEALKKAMIRLMESDELRKKIGAGAKQTILKLPTKEQTLVLYKKSWEKALNL